MTWMVIERPGVKLYKPFYHTVKRILEKTLALLLLLLTLPVLLTVAVAIRLDSQGPVFFLQDRVGKGGRLFKIYKFRTMHPNVNHASHQEFMKAFVSGQIQEAGERKVFKPFQDNDVTRVGRFLRKTSLDELPQLINVFLGDMSFIGPRPNVPWEVAEYRGWHKERLEILPGITGLAQVRGRSAISFDEIVKYDVEYIKKQSFWLDLKIVWWTFTSVLGGRGAH